MKIDWKLIMLVVIFVCLAGNAFLWRVQTDMNHKFIHDIRQVYEMQGCHQ